MNFCSVSFIVSFYCSVMLTRGGTHACDVFRCQRTYSLGGRTDDQRVLRKLLAFGNQCAGADQAVLADLGAIEHDRLNADQGAFANRTAVQHGLMTDCHVLAYVHRVTDVSVQYCTLLNVTVFTDGD